MGLVRQWLVPVSGKWQTRVLISLAEAGHALSTRQLRIRCGIRLDHDPYGSIMRNTLHTMQKRQLIARVGRGMFSLPEEYPTKGDCHGHM